MGRPHPFPLFPLSIAHCPLSPGESQPAICSMITQSVFQSSARQGSFIIG